MNLFAVLSPVSFLIVYFSLPCPEQRRWCHDCSWLSLWLRCAARWGKGTESGWRRKTGDVKIIGHGDKSPDRYHYEVWVRGAKIASFSSLENFLLSRLICSNIWRTRWNSSALLTSGHGLIENNTEWGIELRYLVSLVYILCILYVYRIILYICIIHSGCSLRGIWSSWLV